LGKNLTIFAMAIRRWQQHLLLDRDDWIGVVGKLISHYLKPFNDDLHRKNFAKLFSQSVPLGSLVKI